MDMDPANILPSSTKGPGRCTRGQRLQGPLPLAAAPAPAPASAPVPPACAPAPARHREPIPGSSFEAPMDLTESDYLVHAEWEWYDEVEDEED